MKKWNFFDRIFPASYDFYGMLEQQAQITALGIQGMSDDAQDGQIDDTCCVFAAADSADEVRMDMEKKLVDAFTTPFDRQDIYSLSVEMDRTLEIVKASVLAMVAYEVEADAVVITLSSFLADGAQQLHQAVSLLRNDHKQGEGMIAAMRQSQINIENAYRKGMAELFATAEPMMAMRKREVYRHLRDAAVSFGLTVDRYHKIVVRQA